jgi:hypothetical protein
VSDHFQGGFGQVARIQLLHVYIID